MEHPVSPNSTPEAPRAHYLFGKQLWQNRGRVAGITALVTLASLGYSLSIPNEYSARSAIIAESRSSAIPGQLAGLAALAGVSVGGGATALSPQFFASMLRNPDLQRAVLTAPLARPVPLRRGDTTHTLLDYYLEGDSVTPRRESAALRALQEATTVDLEIKTGVITVGYTSEGPDLSAMIVAMYVGELERFNAETRQSQARAKRVFLDARFREASGRLDSLEAAAREFLSRNRTYSASPDLSFEYERLESLLLAQRELVGEFRRQLHAAEMAELDDTPTITVLERPRAPAAKSGPSRKNIVFGGFLMGLALALLMPAIRFGLPDAAPGLLAALAGFSEAGRGDSQ